MSEETGNGRAGESAGEIGAGNARAHRVLLATVIILGILLVIGFAVVIATIASRIAGGSEADAPLRGPTVSGEIGLPVPHGYRLVSVTGEERRLVLHLAVSEGGPDGAPDRLPDLLMVVDARSGQVVRSLVLVPAAAP